MNENLRKFQDIRHSLQFLTFNSIVEAERLGQRGVVVSAIAGLIKEVSNEWNAIANRAESALAGIMELGGRTNKVVEVFSDSAAQELRDGQRETRAALDKVRDVAEFAAKESAQIQEAMDKMQAEAAASGETGAKLDRCFEGLDQALGEVDALTSVLKSRHAAVMDGNRGAEMERLFGSEYTTEIERNVMKSALNGTPLPTLAPALAGNDVELF